MISVISFLTNRGLHKVWIWYTWQPGNTVETYLWQLISWSRADNMFQIPGNFIHQFQQWYNLLGCLPFTSCKSGLTDRNCTSAFGIESQSSDWCPVVPLCHIFLFVSELRNGQQSRSWVEQGWDEQREKFMAKTRHKPSLRQCFLALSSL